MSLSPLVDAPVARQDSIIEVVPKGDGSHEHDEIFISTTILLSGDLDPGRDVTLLLPMATSAQQRPLMRWTEDDITSDAVTFDPVERSIYDQRVADALEAIEESERKRQKELAKAIADAAKSFSQAVLTVKPGQRQLRFFYTLAATRTADRQFSFEVLAPLASFILQPGGSIGVIAMLARNTSLIEAHGLQDPSNPGSELPRTDAVLGGRTCIGWTWQFDPTFRVTYSY
jgi:hypothetical protein